MFEVDGEIAFPALLIEFEQSRPGRGAYDIDDAIEATQSDPRLLHSVCSSIARGYIGGDGYRLDTQSTYFLRHGFCAGCLAIEYGHPRAGLGEDKCGGPADPLAPTDYECFAVL